MSNVQKKFAKKSKLMSEDIIESQFKNDSTKPKMQKIQRDEVNEEEDITKLFDLYQRSTKKSKADTNIETCQEMRQKLIDVMSHQSKLRKRSSDNLIKSLSEVVSEIEADYTVMKENEQKLEHVNAALLKCIQQSAAAHKKKLKALKEIHTSYKKDCEDMENEHRAENDKLADELEEDIKKLKQKLISETKRSGLETLRRTLFQAMQNHI